MLSLNRYCGVCSRISLVLVYLSFFLVQFDIHFSGSPSISFFSSGYNAQFSQKTSSGCSDKITNKDSRRSGIKLNKRFHPQKHFTIQESSSVTVHNPFRANTFILHEDQPVTSSSFA